MDCLGVSHWAADPALVQYPAFMRMQPLQLSHTQTSWLKMKWLSNTLLFCFFDFFLFFCLSIPLVLLLLLLVLLVVIACSDEIVLGLSSSGSCSSFSAAVIAATLQQANCRITIAETCCFVCFEKAYKFFLCSLVGCAVLCFGETEKYYNQNCMEMCHM